MGNGSGDAKLMEIISKCIAGNRGAQKELYVLFYGHAMSTCMRYCKTKEEALEIVNDGYLKLFRNLPNYQPTHSFKAWFKRILINTSIDYYRSHHKHYNHSDIDIAYNIGQNADAESVMFSEDLMSIVNELPISYKTNFCLFAIDGYSHQEIAEMMGISEGTSKSNVSRARQILRNKLEHVSVKIKLIQ